TLLEGVQQGKVAAIRQVEAVAAQAHRTAGTGLEPGEGFFEKFVTRAAGTDTGLQEALTEAAGEASQAYIEFAEFLRTDIAPNAPEADAFGRERYELASE